MQKAIIYARVSTTRQADDGVSIDAQIEQCEHKAAELGAAVVQIFRDDGITGTSAIKRHAFQRAINYCAYNDVDFFIVWSTSRFARNKIDAASYKQLLKESGTRLVYASMSINSDTDEGWFTESLLEIMDEHYSRQVSRDTKRSMMKNADEGFFNGGRIPLGYKVLMVDKRKKLVPDPTESGLVQQIFKRFANGESAISICRDLNNAGITFRGVEFQAPSLTRILKNEKYIGVTIFNRTTKRKLNPETDWIVKETHEPIIDKHIFEKVQNRFSPRLTQAGSPSSTFFFTGLLRCGNCHSSLVIETATGRNRIYSYYNCNRFRKGYSCKSRRIAADKFDKYLLEMVVDKLLTQDMVKAFLTEMYNIHAEKNSERKERIEFVKNELNDVKRKRDTLINAIENGSDEVSSIMKRISNYDERERALLIEQEKISAEPVFVEPSGIEIDSAVKALRDIITNIKNVRKIRILLQSFIESIEVFDDEIVINYLPERIVNAKAVHSKNEWHAYRDSNPGCYRERVVSSASRR